MRVKPFLYAQAGGRKLARRVGGVKLAATSTLGAKLAGVLGILRLARASVEGVY